MSTILYLGPSAYGLVHGQTYAVHSYDTGGNRVWIDLPDERRVMLFGRDFRWTDGRETPRGVSWAPFLYRTPREEERGDEDAL